MSDVYTRAAEAISEYNPTPLSLRQDFARANLAIVDAGELERMREALSNIQRHSYPAGRTFDQLIVSMDFIQDYTRAALSPGEKQG